MNSKICGGKCTKDGKPTSQITKRHLNPIFIIIIGTLMVPFFLQMRISTINASSVILKAKIFENQKIVKNMKSYSKKKFKKYSQHRIRIQSFTRGSFFFQL